MGMKTVFDLSAIHLFIFNSPSSKLNQYTNQAFAPIPSHSLSI